MKLTQLRSLVAIAETGSVTAAAAALGVTQSGMSQTLAALEDSLGAPLVVRQRHGVVLTAVGEQVLGHARAVLDHVDAIRHAAAGALAAQTGSVRLAAFPSVFATVLPPLLGRFRKRYPAIDLVALETDDREVETWLAAGVVDLGVVLNPAPDRNAVPLGRDAWVAVLPPRHRLAGTGAIDFATLAAEPFVLATGGCHCHAGSLAAAAGLALRDIRLEVRDWASAIALVREGAGVSLVPQSTLPDPRRGLRTARLEPALYRHFGLVATPARPCPPAAALLLTLAGQQPGAGAD